MFHNLMMLELRGRSSPNPGTLIGQGGWILLLTSKRVAKPNLATFVPSAKSGLWGAKGKPAARLSKQGHRDAVEYIDQFENGRGQSLRIRKARNSR